MRKHLSIKEISLKLTNENENLLYGQFLDDFYREKDSEGKFALIKDEPNFVQNNVIFMCILAGTAEKLAHDYGLDVPDWVMGSKYILKEVYYAFDTKNPDFQELLKNTTPEEYKRRNLMVGDTMLARC